jgi:YD repeat-containing protein
MKNTLPAACLILVFVSCQKTPDKPASPAAGEFTSMWSFMPDLHLLLVDSLEFDDRQQLARFKFISYAGATGMAFPANFDPAKHDSAGTAVYSFMYKDKDTLPGGYTVNTVIDGVAGMQETYGLRYDGQGRIVADTLVNGDVSGCLPNSQFVKVHYAYTGSTMIATQALCDGSIRVDTFWLNNDNITDAQTWVYNSPGNFYNFSSNKSTSSPADNPFFKYKILSSYHIGSMLFQNVVMSGMSRQLEKTTALSYYTPGSSITRYSLQWTMNDKNKVVSGVISPEDPTSFPEYLTFHYGK